ncbi:unnamed protein product [Rotaria sordida]|uniref:Uncharacterized protein n=1 Tax=Rotaria sordida TaxID=392033 RepID=A0A814ZFV0_9BILA|nr:unnamed protein product [Rotaria sordida]CAF3764718.1 unnamed protein product [Rotaria sordida]
MQSDQEVDDQILSINDEIAIGINHKHVIHILRSATATNQVRFHVQHFFPPLLSNEYQQLLYDARSTEDDDEDIHQVLNHSINRKKNNYHNTNVTTENEV